MAAAAIASDSFPGRAPDRRIWSIQEKADRLFAEGNYERAMFIYRNELAPLGDKYAQYMIGFMYLSGKGIPVDVVTASAWYRLAGERGDKSLVSERDKLLALLTESQRAESDRVLAELRPLVGDAALIANLIDEDLGGLGRAVAFDSGGRDLYVDSIGLERRAREETVVAAIRNRMEYLERIIDGEALLSESEIQRYADLRDRVRNTLRGR